MTGENIVMMSWEYRYIIFLLVLGAVYALGYRNGTNDKN